MTGPPRTSAGGRLRHRSGVLAGSDGVTDTLAATLVQQQARILVLDGSDATIQLLDGILRDGGYRQIRSFTDPRRFLAEVEAFEPDLILLDLHLLEPDGVTLLAGLSGARRQEFLPVLAHTADTARTRELALVADASDYVTWPFEAQEVLLRVRNLLQTRAMYRALRDRNALLIDAVVERAEALVKSQEARAAIVAALNALPNNRVVAELARGVCSAIRRQPGLDAVVLYGLSPDGATVLAAEGEILSETALADGVSPGHARYLYEKARRGPWSEPWLARPEHGELGLRVARTALRHALYVPLLDAGEPIGILAGGTTSELTAASAEDLGSMLAEYGAIARALLVPELVSQRGQARLVAEIEGVIASSEFRPRFQPIMDLDLGTAIGAEALTRFDDGASPHERFVEAASVGLGTELEIATLEAAVAASKSWRAAAWLSLNVSPTLILTSDRLAHLLAGLPSQIVLEVTEHVPVDDYPALRAAIDRLRPGVALAIDDAGAGFASFRHILELRPDFVKLDRGLVRGIDADPARQALVAGMRYFATATGCALIAEGIETAGELATLRSLGLRIGQGHLLGRPRPLERLRLGGVVRRSRVTASEQVARRTAAARNSAPATPT